MKNPFENIENILNKMVGDGGCSAVWFRVVAGVVLCGSWWWSVVPCDAVKFCVVS